MMYGINDQWPTVTARLDFRRQINDYRWGGR
jgi:hypothetical protein